MVNHVCAQSMKGQSKRQKPTLPDKTKTVTSLPTFALRPICFMVLSKEIKFHATEVHDLKQKVCRRCKNNKTKIQTNCRDYIWSHINKTVTPSNHNAVKCNT